MEKTMNATVVGWRQRGGNGSWYPSEGGWAPCSTTPNINCVAACPENTKKYTNIIKVTMPINTDMEYISSISITVDPWDINNISGYMYGSLRTVDDSTSAQYSISDYRTHVAGDSQEVSTVPTYGTANHESKTYTFYGRFIPGESYYLWLYTKSSDDSYTLKPSSSIYTCTITYNVKTYRVSYDANGGIGAPSYSDHMCNTIYTVSSTTPIRYPDSNSIEFTITGDANGGETNTIATATKTDTTSYSFSGWNTKANGSGTKYTVGSTFEITDDITLYAMWTSSQNTSYSNNTLASLPIPTKSPVKESYTLTLNPNNGQSVTSRNVGKDITYIFKGWSTSSSDSNVLNNNTSYTEAVTVYAVWEATGTNTTSQWLSAATKNESITGSYSITLNTNGGNASSTSLTANIVTTYTFVGWSTTTSKNDIVSNPYIITADTTLTAIWESNSGTKSVVLPSATKDGYNFTGWSEVADSNIFVANPYIPTKNITLYANYKVGRSIKAFLWHDNKWYRLLVE